MQCITTLNKLRCFKVSLTMDLHSPYFKMIQFEDINILIISPNYKNHT